tara:strand:- start:6853 stop:7899 length:1047 start_codon:yes stop_codon:yes gene_type:complete
MGEPSIDDGGYMLQALDEGAKGLGLTSPNPPVGAVVVKDGQVIGRGWHQKAGGPHAEVNAIADAHASSGPSSTVGATIYVTLEPCSTHGRTPPCVEAIQKAGLSRVVVGATDPNPEHAGGGFPLLKEAGIKVTTGIMEKEANHLIRFFAKRVTTGLPWVIAKTAATLDGRTTLKPEDGQWISNQASREDVQRLRQQCDAVLVGGETFRKDNPSLTLRGDFAKNRPQPLRVVLTSDSDLPSTHHLFTDEHADLTQIHLGISLSESLQQLASEGINAVLLESGGRLLSHALELGLVDEIVLYLAPRLGGGETFLVPPLNLATRLEGMEVDLIGTDIRIKGKIISLDPEAK